MNRLLPLLVVFAVGCAVEEGTEEATVETQSSALSFTLPPGTFNPPPPVHPLPPGTPLPVIPPPPPAWATKCGAVSKHFTVLANATGCWNVAGSGGTWTSRTLTTTPSPLCEVTWSGSANADYGALAAIAKPEDTWSGFPKPPAVTAICGSTSVCDPTHATCALRPSARFTGWLPIEGMPGCSSCAFITDTTLYVMLPADYTSSPLLVDLGGTDITVEPTFAQTLRVNLSSYTIEPGTTPRVFRR